MKLLITVTLLLSTVTVSAVPIRFSKRDVDPALVPDLGFQSGVNPTGTGDCDGAVNGPNGQPIKIPCSCPPDRETFLRSLNANVAAGRAVNNPSVTLSFPTGDSKGDKSARITASLITLQNLNGPGVGCPAVSTTLQAQQRAIDAGEDTPPPPPAPAPPAPAPPPPPANGGGDDIERLAPPLGFSSGLNPTGTGDCDGAVNGADGRPIKIPCACPPAQDAYIAALRANVEAGRAVNNPDVQVSFPLGDSKADKNARLHAATVTLQNLNGPGRGCPSVSTTFPAQQREIDALPN